MQIFSMVSGVLIVLLVHAAWAQISYPEHFETSKKRLNSLGRVPVFSPANCKAHELLYPGDQNDDWICDCEPGAVYHPESDRCSPVFRQGPCNKGEFLVLGLNKIIPECIENVCKSDGQVLINNLCYNLGTSGPCPMPELSYVVGVNITTLKLDCVKQSISLHTRFGDEILETSTSTARALTNTIEICARGSKRAIQGRCPETK